MGEYDDLLQVIEKIHLAGTAAEHWPSALASLTHLIGGVGTTLEVVDRKSGAHLMLQSWGVPTGGEIAYLQEYAALNPRLDVGLAQRPGALLNDYQIITEEDIDRSPFYMQFLRPMDMRYALAGILATPATEFSALAVQRSPRQGHASAAQQALMASILPHASQALDVARRLSHNEQRAQDLEASLDWLRDAALLLDADGRVIKANRAAEAMARRRDALLIRGGALEMLDPKAAHALALALTRSTAPTDRTGMAVVDFSARRGEEEVPYVVSVRPIVRESGARLALVFVHDPMGEDADEGLLRAVFGLTPAEAHLAHALGRGISPDAYAAQQNLSRNTVYSHLGKLKDKCGAHRLVQLIRVLNGVRSNLAPSLPPRSPS